MATLYARSESELETIVRTLKESGFTDAEIRPGVVNYHRVEYRDCGGSSPVQGFITLSSPGSFPSA